jgi:hypothetical protein
MAGPIPLSPRRYTFGADVFARQRIAAENQKTKLFMPSGSFTLNTQMELERKSSWPEGIGIGGE